MKHNCHSLIGLLGVLVVIAIILWVISTLPTKTCSWCHEPFTEEGTQLENYWYDDLCWSKLRRYSADVFGIEWSRERIEWILERTGERND